LLLRAPHEGLRPLPSKPKTNVWDDAPTEHVDILGCCLAFRPTGYR
jgi:hypothetical protein